LHMVADLVEKLALRAGSQHRNSLYLACLSPLG
jgi:hypothetical protein